MRIGNKHGKHGGWRRRIEDGTATTGREMDEELVSVLVSTGGRWAGRRGLGL